MPFLPSASCRNLDLPPVNLRFLQSHLTKNAFAIAPTHLCGIALGFRGNFDYHGEHYVKLPFGIKAAYDFNGPCVETYNRFFGEHAEKLDLSATDPKDFADTDVLIGGFPGQEFSSCGPLGGLDSDRGQLYKVMVNYMRIHKPMLATNGWVVIRLWESEIRNNLTKCVDRIEAEYKKRR